MYIHRKNKTHNRKSVPLPTLHTIEKHLNVDCETGVITRKRSSGGKRAGTLAGNVSASGYRSIHVGGGRYLAHRLVYFVATGIDPLDKHVDHINGDTLDNRIENLRLADQSENGTHRVKMDSRNTSGHRNVSWHEKDKRWRVKVYREGTVAYTKAHENLEDAAADAERARKEVYADRRGII